MSEKTLLGLPAELKAAIAEVTPKDDLQNLRLVNKEMGAVATSALFKHIVLGSNVEGWCLHEMEEFLHKHRHLLNSTRSIEIISGQDDFGERVFSDLSSEVTFILGAVSPDKLHGLTIRCPEMPSSTHFLDTIFCSQSLEMSVDFKKPQVPIVPQYFISSMNRLERLLLSFSEAPRPVSTGAVWSALVEDLPSLKELQIKGPHCCDLAECTGSRTLDDGKGIFSYAMSNPYRTTGRNLTTLNLINMHLGESYSIQRAINLSALKTLIVVNCTRANVLVSRMSSYMNRLQDFGYRCCEKLTESDHSNLINTIDALLQYSKSIRRFCFYSMGGKTLPSMQRVIKHSATLEALGIACCTNNSEGHYTPPEVFILATSCKRLEILALCLSPVTLPSGHGEVIGCFEFLGRPMEKIPFRQCIEHLSELPLLKKLRITSLPHVPDDWIMPEATDSLVFHNLRSQAYSYMNQKLVVAIFRHRFMKHAYLRQISFGWGRSNHPEKKPTTNDGKLVGVGQFMLTSMFTDYAICIAPGPDCQNEVIALPFTDAQGWYRWDDQTGLASVLDLF